MSLQNQPLSSYGGRNLSIPHPPHQNQINLQEIQGPSHRTNRISRGLVEKPRRHEPARKFNSKKYQFICVAENGSERRPKLPFRNSQLYRALEEGNFIQEITFDHDDDAYCRAKVLETFSHLPLTQWQFYSADNKHQLVLEPSKSCYRFNLKDLERYFPLSARANFRLASGNGSRKKIYLGPIAPQSFLIEENITEEEGNGDMNEGAELDTNDNASNMDMESSHPPLPPPEPAVFMSQQSPNTSSSSASDILSTVHPSSSISSGWTMESIPPELYTQLEHMVQQRVQAALTSTQNSTSTTVRDMK
jgi:hypothetical protein